MVVLDASAAVDLVAARPAASEIERLIRGQALKAPAHFDAEALAGIRGLVLSGAMAPERAATALRRVDLLPLERVAIPPLFADALAVRSRFSAQDALYAVLARRESALVVTTDARFARACEGFVAVTLAA
jgi:predicted nucleic acid-binding protein